MYVQTLNRLVCWKSGLVFDSYTQVLEKPNVYNLLVDYIKEAG